MYKLKRSIEGFGLLPGRSGVFRGDPVFRSVAVFRGVPVFLVLVHALRYRLDRVLNYIVTRHEKKKFSALVHVRLELTTLALSIYQANGPRWTKATASQIRPVSYPRSSEG